MAGAVAALLAVVVLQNSTTDQSGGEGADASTREYGILDYAPSRSATGTDDLATDIAETVATNGGSADGRDDGRDNRRDNETGLAGGVPDTAAAIEGDSSKLENVNGVTDAYQVSHRRTRGFDRKLLAESGFDEAEIEKVEQGMRDYAKWLRDSSGGAPPTASIKLSPEERDARRQAREGFLSDVEYEAALFATGQQNAAVFARAKEGGEAWDAGIRSGDTLVLINGVRIFDLMDFVDGLDQLAAGETHVLGVLKGGEQTTITVPCCRPGWGPVDMTTTRPSGAGSAD